MMSQLLKHILAMSAAGSTLAVVLLLLKPVTHRFFSPRWQYFMWITVFILFAMPLTVPLPIQTPFDFANPGQISSTGYQQPIVFEDAFRSHAASFTAQGGREPGVNFMSVLGIVWISAAFGVFLFRLSKYFLFRIKIYQTSWPDAASVPIPKKLTIRRSSLLDAPLMIGLIRPVLFIPDFELNEEDIQLILVHELVHYKRHDLCLKWFAVIVGCLHWFNPIFRIAFKQFEEECEISCDFEATKSLSSQERDNYMRMILNLISNSCNPKVPAASMAGSDKIIKRRFTMIRNMKKQKKAISFLSVILSVFLLTSTAFASGVLQDTIHEDSPIKVFHGDTELSYQNKPFLSDEWVYLPLRETLNGFGINDIEWDNGTIRISLPDSSSEQLWAAYCEIQTDSSEIHYTGNIAKGNMKGIPILLNGVTYVPCYFFSDLVRCGQIPDYRLEWEQSLSPESYYTPEEEVFIGTPEEQEQFHPVDEYGNKRYVKRIIVDEKNNTIAVVTAENQMPEKLREIPNAGLVSCNGYTSLLQSPRLFTINANGKYVEVPCAFMIYQNQEPIAYIPMTYQINLPAAQLPEN